LNHNGCGRIEATATDDDADCISQLFYFGDSGQNLDKSQFNQSLDWLDLVTSVAIKKKKAEQRVQSHVVLEVD
jgi:hypothetical protein